MRHIFGRPRPDQILESFQNAVASGAAVNHQGVPAIVPATYAAAFVPCPDLNQLDTAIKLAQVVEHRVVGMWTAATKHLPQTQRIRYNEDSVSAVTLDLRWLVLNPWIVAHWCVTAAITGRTPALVQGIVGHELAHILYTPMGADNWVERKLLEPEEFQAANILEDGRIEILLGQQYPLIGKHLGAVLEVVFANLKDDLSAVISGYPVLAGRRHAPHDLEAAVKEMFEAVAGEDISQRITDIKDEYNNLGEFQVGSRGEKRAVELAKEFHNLFAGSSMEIAGPGCGMSSDCREHSEDEDGDRSGEQARKHSGQGTQPSGSGSADDDDSEDEDGKNGSGEGGDGLQDSEEEGTPDILHNKGSTAVGKEAPISLDDIIPDMLRALEDAINDIEQSWEPTRTALRDEDLQDHTHEQLTRSSADLPETAPARGFHPMSISNAQKEWDEVYYPKEAEIRRLLTDKTRYRTRQPRGSLHLRSILKEMPHSGDNYRRRTVTAQKGHGQVEVVAAYDTSGSMNAADLQVITRCMSYIKRLCDNLRIPASVISWNTSVTLLYARDDKGRPAVARFPSDVNGGTNPDWASSLAMRILGQSDKPNKLYLNMTDGHWYDHDVPLMNNKRKVGCTAHLVLFGDSVSGSEENESFQGYDTVSHTNDAAGVAEIFVDAIRRCVEATRAGRRA